MAAMLKLLLVFLLCFSALLPSAVEAETSAVQELYVRPTATTHCPETHDPCLTLDEYVRNATQYFVSNTTFHFLTGTHNLSQTISVSGVAQLAMVADNGFVNIICSSNSFVSFTEIYNLTLSELAFVSCDTLKLLDVSNLQFLSIAMRSPSDLPVAVNSTNIMGASTIANFSFLPFANSSEHCVNQTFSVFYTDPLTYVTPKTTNTHLFVRDSVFGHPSSCMWLELMLWQTTFKVSIHLENITSIGNVGSFVLEVYLASTTPNLVNITGLSIEHAYNHTAEPYYTVRILDALSTTFYQVQPSTVSISKSHLSQALYLCLNSVHIFVSNCVFSNLSQVYMYTIPGSQSYQSTITMRNVTFTNIALPKCGQTIGPCFSISLYNTRNVTFIDCKFTRNPVGRTESVLSLQRSSNIFFTNCEFSENIGTPITTVDSTFVISGFNNFSYNQAYKGGALAFYGASYILMSYDSKVLFQSNRATVGGGAIYVDYGFDSPCFLQFIPTSGNCSSLSTPAKLIFYDNVADNGGNSIYGASLDTCRLGSSSCYGWNLVGGLLPPNDASNLSSISSSPVRACLCNGDGLPSCTKVFMNHTVYPGEDFNISAVVVGDMFGTVDGLAYAQLLSTKNSSEGPPVVSLGQQQGAQNVNHKKCANLVYTIFSKVTDSVVVLVLTANSMKVENYPSHEDILEVQQQIHNYSHTGEILPLFRSFPVYINVSLLPCPLGFMLSHQSFSQCVCDKQLSEHGLTCDLTTKTVQIGRNIWVNASFKKSESGVILSTNCPNNYCKSEFRALNLSLDDPNAQCAYHRSGILCGGCQSGRSLALGSNRCLQYCSSYHLALLIPFALAGFAMVFFLKLLNLTVAEGTINGLIFYANIVRANHRFFMPEDGTYVFRVFMAWLNLDLGIEACFFDGMDAYWKTWLEFVFPLYIWTLVILIIVLTRYFSLVAKVFGNNSVPILATLCLLSYAKLLRVIIAILQSSTLYYSDGTTEKVWSYDGNITYFSAKHIPLVLVAMVFVVFLWLPYTTFLTFAQCILRSSNYTVTKLLCKVKPFLDAYIGPFKKKHRYWVGLLLLIRGALFAVFAATSTALSSVNFLVIVLVVLILLVYLSYTGSVYRNVYHSLLENMFFLNLGFLAGGTLYVRSSGGSQTALANVSMGIAFILFLAIVVRHLFVLLRRQWPETLQKLRSLQSRTLHRSSYQGITSVQADTTSGSTRHEPDSSCRDLREPVMKYLDSHA